ncbi:hypothetical protein NIES4102_14790 [Chondrocystis sp. NIES-4102]|nr:hypothetical protein NIES4102_14790 [Chondrocystis sp. NIES-4102]
MQIVFHIVARKETENRKSRAYYEPSSLLTEGFIHCSYLHQVCRVANLFYQGQTDLLLMEIDKTKIGCQVIDEDLYDSGETFPHVYGKIPWYAVIAVHEFPTNEDGTFNLPSSVVAK